LGANFHIFKKPLILFLSFLHLFFFIVLSQTKISTDPFELTPAFPDLFDPLLPPWKSRSNLHLHPRYSHSFPFHKPIPQPSNTFYSKIFHLSFSNPSLSSISSLSGRFQMRPSAPCCLPVPLREVSHRSKFTPDEDAQLSGLVKAYGEKDWLTIAALMTGRTPRQCRERWRHYLAPSIVSTPFTLEEDARLLEKHRELGSKWKAMAVSFEGRTDINLKNRWLFLTRHQKRAEAARHDLSQPSDQSPALPQPAVTQEQHIPWSSEDENDHLRVTESTGDLTGDYFCLNFACWD
jgi:hypothetical protein